MNKIEKELEELGVLLDAWTQKHEVATKLIESLEKERDRLLMAKVEGQKNAEAELEQVEQQIEKVKSDRRRADGAVGLIGKKIRFLEEKKQGAERNEKRRVLETESRKWIAVSKKIQKLIDELTDEVERYQEDREKVFAAAHPLTGRQLGLEKKSTVANYIHKKLSRLLPHDFIWISEKLSPCLFEMDKAIAEALLGKADASLEDLQQGLQADIRDELINREKAS